MITLKNNIEKFNFSFAKYVLWCIIYIMSKRKNIEDKLRKAILDAKISRYKISQLSGVGEAQLSLFVNRKRTLTLTSAAKVAETLGLDLIQKKAGGK